MDYASSLLCSNLYQYTTTVTIVIRFALFTILPLVARFELT